ncbi:MAG: YgiQ family radical SAM protein [Firmicutes bacterium]|nr:YgiQ family radical SAM protein [Bacillota bacterium]
MKRFLPVNQAEMAARSWDYVDFALITGDAYVDHPSFGVAIISRVLEHHGYRVGIIAQPDWRDVDSFRVLGRPRLGFMITAGNIDSMVNHYTVAKKRRSTDAYSPGGKSGLRPDRASIVYANRAREAYSDVPIILGGIEASLRRLAHYDYWSDRIRRSILLDSKADLLIYGMAETALVEVAKRLEQGIAIERITNVPGTVVRLFTLPEREITILPHYDQITTSKKAFAESFMLQYENTDHLGGEALAEPYGDFFVLQNPPAAPLSEAELDRVYALPFVRNYHPSYEDMGGVPAIAEVKFSLISNRGCFGGCHFCALSFHQGRVVQARSTESLVKEAEQFLGDPVFKGYIHDVGGPTANFQNRACERQKEHGVCKKRQCMVPRRCKNLVVDHRRYLRTLRSLRSMPGVKRVFIRSGIRYDYLIYDRNPDFFRELCAHHISGQLKVAPEHVSSTVLEKMGKPQRTVYDRFTSQYDKYNRELGKKQHLVPYFMSSHPGSDLHSAIELAEYIRDTKQMPEQVQDFYPTPGTLSTCMYYTGLDPRTMERVYVAKDPREKAMQRALIHYSHPRNYKLVFEALTKAGRTDLIGHGAKCLIRPKQSKKTRRRA